ncbi:MAG: type IV pilus modification PilV family protein [Kiritimatiellia bacterium]|jgi:hypothetical protein
MQKDSPFPLRHRSRAAFTLIELALAVFVTGVAVLGVFGLLRLGVGASTEAEDELRAALFAEDVFTTLRVYSDAMLDVRDTNRWQKLCAESGLELDPESPTLFSDFWAALAEWEGQNGMPCLPDFWEAPDSGPGESTTPYPIRIHVVGPDDPLPDETSTNVFCAVDIRGTNPGTIPEYTLRYLLTVTTNESSRYVAANLNVWPGLDVRRRSDYTFYTHIYERGERP